MSTTMNSEASRKFGEAVLEAVGAPAQHVLADSFNVEVVHGEAMARVTWQGAAMVPVETIHQILEEVQA